MHPAARVNAAAVGIKLQRFIDTIPKEALEAAEEYGLLLVLGILALYGVIVVRSLWRLLPERDPFARLAGAGMACIFGVQAMINMGVAVRLLPAKGMTLPFVSYGGTSMLAVAFGMGLLLALIRKKPEERMATGLPAYRSSVLAPAE